MIDIFVHTESVFEMHNIFKDFAHSETVDNRWWQVQYNNTVQYSTV